MASKAQGATGSAKAAPAAPTAKAFGKADIERAEQALKRAFGPWAWLSDPVLHGLDKLPAKGPALYAGNHTLMGVLDAPVMFIEIARRKGIVLRSLGDHAHFQVPGWRDFMQAIGCVDGTRENCAELMRLGEQIVVFPGGGGEVFKRKGEQYRLRWKERLGFVRMAVAARCPIVPFAAVGGDDLYDIVLGSDEISATPLGQLLLKAGVRQEALGVYRGVGPSLLPRAERLYFMFGDPIPTARYKGNAGDEEVCRTLRDQVKQSVESMIDQLLELRQKDPDRPLGKRLLRKLQQARA